MKMDKSNVDIIQLNPEKSLHLRGNITVTPICLAKETPIATLSKARLDPNTTSSLSNGLKDSEGNFVKKVLVDSPDNLLTCKNKCNSSKAIYFEGSKLNEETAIVPLKVEPLQVKNVITTSSFTTVSTVAPVIVPNVKTKTENLSKMNIKSLNNQQISMSLSESSVNTNCKTVKYKPIAPKSREKEAILTYHQLVKPLKSNFVGKKSISLQSSGKSKKKILVSYVTSKDNCDTAKEVKNEKSTQRKINSYAEGKTKHLSMVSGMTKKEQNDISSTLILTSPNLQGTVKMSVTNGPLATLKSNNSDIPIEVKSNGNKSTFKRTSSIGITAIQKANNLQKKSSYSLKRNVPHNQLNVQNKSVLSSHQPLVNDKYIDHKSPNDVLHKITSKLVKVKGNQIAANTSVINLQNDKQQTSTNATEMKIKSSNKSVPFKRNTSFMSNRTLMKKKIGKRYQSLNSETKCSLDTELSFTQKQTVAHEILAQLLVVTSQLPMVKFSHALETIEMITDAYKLGHRVNVSILRNEESNINDIEAFDVCYESDIDKGSEKLAATQVDGQLDIDGIMKFFEDESATVSTGIDEETEATIQRSPAKIPLSLLEIEPMEEDISSIKRKKSDEFSVQFPKRNKLKTDN